MVQFYAFVGKLAPRHPVTASAYVSALSHISHKGVFWALECRAKLAIGPWLRGSHGALACVFSFPQTEQVERNYIKEKKAAVKEFEDKKVELKENLIAELEEKKKMIENEKLTMELTGGMKAPQSRVPGALGGASSLLPQFLVRAEQLEGGWALTRRLRVLALSGIGCVTLVKPLNISEPFSPSIK